MPPAFSLDGVLSLPIFNKWVLAAFVAYRGTNLPFPPSSSLTNFDWSTLSLKALPRYSKADRTLKFAYFVLACYIGQFLNDRWRNGVFNKPPRIRGQAGWSKEVAFVTGGASGIAKATCQLLASKGCNVATVDINDFPSTHPRIRTYKCDITSMDGLKAVQAQIRKDFGKDPTMVLNIAGLNNKALILDLNETKIRRMIDVNLTSHFFTALVFLPDMIKKKRGHFLSIGSTMSYAGICHQSDYAATKHGLVGMMEAFRYELDKMYKVPHVRTSLAVIGHTATPLFQDFKVKMASARFMGPLVTPEEIAEKLVDALEAQESRYICHPFQNRTVFALHAMPSWLRDYMQWSSAADGTYDSRPTPEQLGH